MHDLSDVRYIKRIVVGSDNPSRLLTRADIDQAMQEVNACLCGTPRGRLLCVERSFALVQIGEHQVVLQWMAYHIGFARRPPPPLASAPTPSVPPMPTAQAPLHPSGEDVVLDPVSP